MKHALLASAALLALMPFSASAQEKTLTISVYAFAQDDFKSIVYDPFQAKCGCKLVVETGNSVERLAKMEANKANPLVDMAVVSMADALSATRKGLIDKIDTSKLSNFAKLYDIAKDPNGDGMSVGYTFYATSIAYRSDKMKIDSWADLLKPEYVGHVAFPNVTTNQGPPALYMLGLALGKDTPDLKAPIEALGEKKDDIVTFYEKSSPLVHFWLSTDIQTKLAEKLVDSPANKEVKLSDEAAGNLTYGEDTAKSLKLIPSAAALDNRAGWLKEWNDKVGQ
jgi:putative spermidine/putrescine transport system substrate-binding protein